MIRRWAATHARALPYGRSVHELGPLAHIGGQPVDARLRHGGGPAPLLELSLHDLPAKPAALALDELQRDAGSLVRQLEHRVADLPDLAARLDAERQGATREQAKANSAAERPFKHAEALQAARQRSAAIATQMTERQQPTDAAAPTAQQPSGAGAKRSRPAAKPARRELS